MANSTDRNQYLVERHSTQHEKDFWKKRHNYELPISLVELLEQIETTAKLWEAIKKQ